MITQTALRSPRFLRAIKAATVRAIRSAHAGIVPAAAVWIENRRGEANLYVQACRGRSPEYRDTSGRNLTGLVLAALRDWHGALRQQRAAKRAAGQPLRLEDFAETAVSRPLTKRPELGMGFGDWGRTVLEGLIIPNEVRVLPPARPYIQVIGRMPRVLNFGLDYPRHPES